MSSNANARHKIISDFAVAETVLDMRASIPLVISHGEYVTEWTLWINARNPNITSDCANAETDLDIRTSIPAGNRMEIM